MIGRRITSKSHWRSRSSGGQAAAQGLRCAIVLAAAAMLTFTVPAKAEDTAEQKLAVIDARKLGSDFDRFWLAGVSTGTDWANAQLRRQGVKPLYCMPENLVLAFEQNVEILRAYIKRKPEVGKFPAGLVMLNALEETFPCK